MATFYLTFGQRYRREPHPHLGARPELPDGWLTVEAGSLIEAWTTVKTLIGHDWGGLRDEDDFDPSFYPAGHLGSLRQAVAHHRG